MYSYIGIDNGTSGTIGVITEHHNYFWKTPTKKEQDYTKKKQNITRIDVVALDELLNRFENPFAVLERPFTGKYVKTMLNGMRALEATLTFLESNGIGHVFIDSKAWQRDLLPQGIKGSTDLKKASRDIGVRMFPQHKELIMKHGDADGILIAEYARRNF